MLIYLIYFKSFNLYVLKVIPYNKIPPLLIWNTEPAWYLANWQYETNFSCISVLSSRNLCIVSKFKCAKWMKLSLQTNCCAFLLCEIKTIKLFNRYYLKTAIYTYISLRSSSLIIYKGNSKIIISILALTS